MARRATVVADLACKLPYWAKRYLGFDAYNLSLVREPYGKGANAPFEIPQILIFDFVY